MLPKKTYYCSPEQSSVSTAVMQRAREMSWRRLCLAVILFIGLAVAQTCLAAENEFDLNPKWLRPGPEAAVRVKLPAKIDVNRKMFLRLTLRQVPVIDLALTGEQVRRRVADVKIPESLKRGIYSTELVNEDGVLIATGPQKVKVAAAQKPAISAIMPKVAYPQNDRYSFEIIGDNFTNFEEEKIIIRINDVAFENMKKCPVDASGKVHPPLAENDLPCLVSDWRSIQIHGLSIDKVGIGRPLEISIEVDKLISDPKPLALSYVQRYTPIVISVIVLAAVIALLYFFFIRKIADRKSHKTAYSPWLYLIIDTQTNTYSLSKLQMIIWSAAAIVAYSYLAASQFLVQWKLGIPNVPGGLPMLLGISAGTTALAVGATEFRGSKGAGMVHPALSDFITTGGVFAPERLQFFLWTILGAITFVAATLAQDPGMVSEMATIPDTFNQLMGASSLGYLAGKFSRKPGPVIKSVNIDNLPGEIKITGENLSPRAQLWINGQPAAYLVPPTIDQNAADEFVSVLTLTPEDEDKGIDNVAQLKIKNPDGQLAEWLANVHPDEPPAKKPGKKVVTKATK